MKHISLKVLAVASLLAGVSASASNMDRPVKNYALGSYQLGVANVNYNKGGTSGSAPYIGVDYFGKAIFKDMHLGLGFDVNTLPSVTNGSKNYTFGGELKVGYSLENILHHNAGIKVDVGYSYTNIGSAGNWGVTYGIGMESEIYKHWGVGYKFKHVDTGFANLTYNANLFYAAFMF